MSHEEFRESLVEDLVAEKASLRREKRRRRAPAGPLHERLSGRHFPSKAEKRRRCVVCMQNGHRRDTPYFCKTCTSTPALHVEDCFEAYHTKENF
ncbi:hypothetical protein J6590_099047 [Homalodisca vitripennis]|nr:hypothetical protein J6590_099047 [Homalodisca vitripennis]